MTVLFLVYVFVCCFTSTAASEVHIHYISSVLGKTTGAGYVSIHLNKYIHDPLLLFSMSSRQIWITNTHKLYTFQWNSCYIADKMFSDHFMQKEFLCTKICLWWNNLHIPSFPLHTERMLPYVWTKMCSVNKISPLLLQLFCSDVWIVGESPWLSPQDHCWQALNRPTTALTLTSKTPSRNIQNDGLIFVFFGIFTNNYYIPIRLKCHWRRSLIPINLRNWDVQSIMQHIQ